MPESWIDGFCEQVPALALDSEDRIERAGAAALRLLRCAPEALVGQGLDDVMPLDAAVPGGARSFRGPSGEMRLRATRVEPEPGRRLVLLEDVSALEHLRGECVHLNKLAAAGRLVSSIVHEINNPLSGIIGYSQLLLMRDLDHDVRGAVEKVYGEALRASRIVRNLLDFSRKRQTATGRVRVGQTLRKALELKSHDLRIHNISVHLDVSDALPPISGDSHQFLQVFVNLVANAEHAMYAADRGGRIDIEAAERDGVLTVVIRDTGPGIPEELRARVFEPFFTTKADGQGTGLGLALCRDILGQHGAEIELAQDGRTGATFVLSFRVYDEQPAAPEATLGARRRPRIRGRRIVVVEDDPVCRALVVEAFEGSGNVVQAFDRSEPALRYLRGHGVDVIVTDLHRPGLNGIEFLDGVRAIDPSLAERVVFMTGDASHEELTQAALESGTPVVQKPVLLHDLYDAVHGLLTGRGGRQKTLFSPDTPPPGGLNGSESRAS